MNNDLVLCEFIVIGGIKREMKYIKYPFDAFSIALSKIVKVFIKKCGPKQLAQYLVCSQILFYEPYDEYLVGFWVVLE